MGDSAKCRFYELDHASKMRLRKTNSSTSNSLTMEAGKRDEKQLKETQTQQQANHPLISCLIPPVWRGGGGAENDLRQTNHIKGTMTRQTLIERKGNSGAYTGEK